VTKTRKELIDLGFKFKGADEMLDNLTKVVSDTDAGKLPVAEWAKDLNLPETGDVILFVDYFMATQMTNILRLVATILKKAEVNFGIVKDPKPVFTYELDYLGEKGVAYAKHNMEALKKTGAKKVIVPDPHVFVSLTKEYPRLLKEDPPFDVVYVTDFVAELIKEGKLKPEKPVKKKVTYHDACMLNKVSGIWESPREILKCIPGIEFVDEDHVSQWYYCCGNGASEVRSFKTLHEDLSYRIGLKRLRRALDLEVTTLALTCPHCNEQFSEVKVKSNLNIEILDIFEILADSLGLR